MTRSNFCNRKKDEEVFKAKEPYEKKSCDCNKIWSDNIVNPVCEDKNVTF